MADNSQNVGMLKALGYLFVSIAHPNHIIEIRCEIQIFPSILFEDYWTWQILSCFKFIEWTSSFKYKTCVCVKFNTAF